MRLFHIFILAVLTTKVFAQGALFNAGDSYMVEFSSLSYSRPIAFPNEASQSGSGHFLVVFPPYAVGDGDSFLLEAFADSLADTPKSRVFTFPENQLPDGVYLGFLWWPGYELFWPDLQGIVRFTMLTGSAEVSSFSIKQIVDGSVYEQSFAVPEPSALALMSVGLVFVLLRKLPSNKSDAHEPPPRVSVWTVRIFRTLDSQPAPASGGGR